MIFTDKEAATCAGYYYSELAKEVWLAVANVLILVYLVCWLFGISILE